MNQTPWPARVLTLAVLALGACQQVPVTGRSALNLVNHDDVLRVSALTFEKLKHDNGVISDARMNDQLRRVGVRLSHVVFWDIPDADWEFVVLNQPSVINAHSMAGGKIAVTSGFFRIIENDDQLAWVVGHEMAHLAAHHSDERISRGMISQGGALAVAAGGAASGGLQGAQAAVQAYNLPAGLLSLSFDRSQELEADYIGLIYMARAGYDPEQGARMFDNMVEAKTASGAPIPAAIFSTHPSYPDRADQLRAKTPEAVEVYRRRGMQSAPIIIR